MTITKSITFNFTQKDTDTIAEFYNILNEFEDTCCDEDEYEGMRLLSRIREELNNFCDYAHLDI